MIGVISADKNVHHEQQPGDLCIKDPDEATKGVYAREWAIEDLNL
jgi:hypothetical protein